MQIYVNGEDFQLEQKKSLKALLAELGYQGKKIAVELNEEIIPLRLHEETLLQENDRVEIVQAIGGG